MIGILLAAGRGTRMKSDRPKVLFTVNGEPMAFAPYKHLLGLCSTVGVVIGYGGPDVKDSLLARASDTPEMGANEKTVFFTQPELKGTGDAVRIALQGFARSGHKIDNDEEVIVLNGDLPLIRKQTLDHFLNEVRKKNTESACMTFVAQNPAGFGRILRDVRGVFSSIREDKDAKVDEKKIREVNSGVYYFRGGVLQATLEKLSDTNSQREFYLTDTLGSSSGFQSEAIRSPFKWDLSGVNTAYELAVTRSLAQARLQKVLADEHGVSFADPLSCFVSSRVIFEGPCTIGPNVQLLGKTKLGPNVEIVGSSLIEDSELGENVFIDFSSVLRNSTIKKNARVGPFAHLRAETLVEEGARIGNFVELKKTKFGARAKANHLSYLGDAEVGEETNIGCGTITCNFDGVTKHRTLIGKRAFIGSDSQLVAPVKIGDDAYIASGTTLTEDVPEGALAITRPELHVKPGYAIKLKERLKAKGIQD